MKARDEAVIFLSQLASVEVAFHQVHLEVSFQAACVDSNPSATIAVCTAEEPSKRRERKDHMVRCLTLLRNLRPKVSSIGESNLFGSSALRSVLNRMVVVAGAAGLEYFLTQAGQPLLPEIIKSDKKKLRNGNRFPPSFSRICEAICTVTDLKRLEGYDQGFLLSCVRHCIVHNQGLIDQTFIDSIKALRVRLAVPFKRLAKGDPLCL